MIRVRDGTPGDAQAVTDIINRDQPEPLGMEQVRERLTGSSSSSRTEWRLVAEAEDAQAARRQGIGSTIHKALLDWARSANRTLCGKCSYTVASSEVAARHGYQIE